MNYTLDYIIELMLIWGCDHFIVVGVKAIFILRDDSVFRGKES